MSTTVIDLAFKVEGVLTDVTSAVLRNPDNTFGVRRIDTGAMVVAAGEELIRQAQGIYSYSFVDPADGLTYNYFIEVVYQGKTIRFERDQSAPLASADNCYCTLSEGRTIANALPGLTAFKAANDADVTAALILATLDIDNCRRYQGRRYDASQPLEFPRAAYSGGWGVAWNGISLGTLATDVWDWDSTNHLAIIPRPVKQACVFQADAILGKKLEKALDDQYLGVASKAVGSLSVSYRDPAALLAAGGMGGLCRRAEAIMANYALRQGDML